MRLCFFYSMQSHLQKFDQVGGPETLIFIFMHVDIYVPKMLSCMHIHYVCISNYLV